MEGLVSAPVTDRLTKSTCFTLIEEAIKRDVVMKQEQLTSFVAFLNKDLLRQQNTLQILQIFTNLLDKYRAGVYSEIPQFDVTTATMLTVLYNIMKDGNWNCAEVKELHGHLLKLLLDIPDHIYKNMDIKRPNPIINLLELYLTTQNTELPSHTEVLSLFKKILNSLPEEKKIEFVQTGLYVWLCSLLTFIFKKDNANREFGVLIAEEIMPLMNKIDYFDNPLWMNMYTNFLEPSKYPSLLINLLNKEDPLWCRLWILIIGLSGRELHKVGSSINSLLFVLQESFKKSVDIKLHSFQCLKALIDNFALDPKIIYNSSRIKVMSTALESNNAKTVQVALLKFNVWWHLITLLKPKLKNHSNMILLPFLKYCFSDPKKNLDSKSKRLYPGEVFSVIQKLAIKAFVEICGHSHCSGCVEDFSKLSGCILDSEMLEQSYACWIYSLKQMTIYTWKHIKESDKTEAERLEQNLKCVWTSFIKASSKINSTESFSSIFEHILKLISLYVEEYSSDPSFAKIILTVIIPSLVCQDDGYSKLALNNNSIRIYDSENPIKSIIKMILLQKMYHKELMTTVKVDFKNIIDAGLSSGVKEFSKWLTDNLTCDNYGPQLWCSLVKGLMDNQITTPTLSTVLMWPINSYNTEEKIQDISVLWKQLLNIQKSKIRSVKNKSLLQFEEDLLFTFEHTNNDLLLIHLFPAFIRKQADDRPANIEFFDRHFAVFIKCLEKLDMTKINISQGTALCDALNIFASLLAACHTYIIPLTVAKFLLSVIDISLKVLIFFFNSNYQDFIKSLSNSTDFINSFLEILTKINTPPYSSHFMTNIQGLLWVLMKNVKDVDIDARYSQLLQQKSFDKSELVKIQQLLKTNKRTKKRDLNNMEKPVSVFGKDITKDTEDFVVIKPTWKFDPKNLTDHQKDVLKRRRDDIPALYEDLSQSQDIDTMKSWKPPGYKSDSQGDSSLSHDVSVSSVDKIIKNVDVENRQVKIQKSSSPFTSLKKIKTNDAKNQSIPFMASSDNITSPRTSNYVMKESNTNGTPKDRVDQIKSSDLKKTNQENCAFVSMSPVTSAKKKSLLLRLDENIRNMKGGVEDDSPKRSNTPESPILAINNDIQELDKTIPLTPSSRPIRIRRKPSKFLNDDSQELSKPKLSSDEDKSSQESATFLESVPSSSKKKRLMKQLDIDTNEGHPLLNKVNSTSRTRRSVSKLSDTFESLAANETSQHDIVNQMKSIHSMDTDCCTTDTPKIEEKSIFSQQTEDFVKITPELDNQKVNELVNNYSEGFECSPDFIASSQEDADSISSVMVVVSKSKDTSSITDVSKKYFKLSSQQLAEADTEPMDDVNEGDDDHVQIMEEQELSTKSLNIVDKVNVKDVDVNELLVDDVIDLVQEVETNKEHVIDVIDLDDVTVNETHTADAVAVGDPEKTLSTNNMVVIENAIYSPPIVSELTKETLHTVKKVKPTLETYIELKDEDNTQIHESLDSSNKSYGNISIISSPCKADVEERNLELMNNTLDLSPIKGAAFSCEDSPVREVSPEKPDCDAADTPKDISSLAKILEVTSPDLFSTEKVEKNPDSPPSPEKSSINSISKWRNSFPSMKFDVNTRTGRLLKSCMDDDDNRWIDNIEHKKDVSPIKTPSCKTSTVETLRPQPLLELTGIMPCATASPIGPILKRKLEADGMTLSPSSKKKRVSFHDPPVSTMVNVEKYIVPRTPKSPVKLLKNFTRNDINDNKQPRVMVATCLLNKIESIEKVSETDDDTSKDSTNEIASISVTDSQISDLCSLTVEIPQPLEIVTNHLLNDKDSIFPSLVDCTTPISEISSDLSSPLWNDEFLKEITDSIMTIGDLAKLTELEINRMPFKSPKIETVMKVLDGYEKKMKDNKITDSFFNTTFNEKPNEDIEMVEVRNDASTDVIPPVIINKPVVEVIDEIKILMGLLDRSPTVVINTVAEKLSHSAILDSIPSSSLMTYVLDKMDNDLEFSDEIKLKLGIEEACRNKCNNLMKSVQNQLSSQFSEILNSFDKF